MFNIAAFNRLLRLRRQHEKVILHANDSGLSAKQISAGVKALRLLHLTDLENLQRNDLLNFLYTMGLNPTPDVLDGKLRQLRLHREQRFTWGELVHVWALLMRDAVNEDVILERAFQFFDKDGNGEISVAELRTTMHELGDLLTEQEIQAFMGIMDTDNDGIIGYQEFLQTLRTEAPEFAGKAMRATCEDGSCCSSSTASLAGSPSDSGCRQFRLAAAATPRQDAKSWLSPRISNTATAAQAGALAVPAAAGSTSNSHGSFDGVHRSSAALVSEDFEPAADGYAMNVMATPRVTSRHSLVQQKQQKQQQQKQQQQQYHL